MKRARALIATLAMLGLAGCVSINRVPAGPVALSKGQSITLQSDWAEVTPVMPQRQNAVRVLSIDGPALNRLYLIQGLPSGQGMVKRIAKEKPVPVFRADLSPTELVESWMYSAPPLHLVIRALTQRRTDLRAQRRLQ